MDASVPDGLGWQLSFLPTRLEVEASLPLCSFLFLHLLQPGETQDGYLGPVDSGCCGPQSLPIHWSLCLLGLCSHLGRQWAPKEMAASLGPDTQICVLGNSGTPCPKAMVLFVLTSGATLRIFYWFPRPGYHPDGKPWAHIRARLPLPGDSTHTFLFMRPLRYSPCQTFPEAINLPWAVSLLVLISPSLKKGNLYGTWWLGRAVHGAS